MEERIMQDRLRLYTSVVPSPVQKNFQDLGFNVFIHYGINTFAGKEWSDGTYPPSLFNPSRQDTDKWAETVKAAGAKGIILTCKHHDGFCLWQTDTTDYSVASSPYKGGKGDVVKELSDSCRKYGLKFGVYLSPWDRNSPLYGTEGYNDFYIRQLTELLTRYGEIFCVWLDGACGSYMDGKPKQVYDFERIYDTVRKLQPNCAISNCGPDVRWVGNEAGQARKSEWNVVPEFSFDVQKIEENSQQADDSSFRKKGLDAMSEDLGSREILSRFDSFIWYPAEVDVSVRPGWFWHRRENCAVRSLNNLTYIYYTSVGGNSLLLLNVPPDTSGQICKRDEKVLCRLGQRIRDHFAKKIKCTYTAENEDTDHPSSNLDADTDGFYRAAEITGSYEITAKFSAPAAVDKVLLRENCDFSQRVESFDLFAVTPSGERKVYSGTTIGFKRIAVFKKVTATALRLVITSCRLEPYMDIFQPYAFNGKVPSRPLTDRISAYIRNIGQKSYYKKLERQNAKKEG